MINFQKGTTSILVSTTVIEVGIDVPNATVMVIRHPERFGLATLHQLRGRVGRGSEQSFCILLHDDTLSAEALQRLSVLATCNDGFTIAEEDLKQRGAGEITGRVQSGFASEFTFADIFDDARLLEMAREDAADILKNNDSAEVEKILGKETRFSLLT